MFVWHLVCLFSLTLWKLEVHANPTNRHNLAVEEESINYTPSRIPGYLSIQHQVKRRPEADAAGFYGDTFSNGFGEFETMKRKMPSYGYKAMEKVSMDPRYYSQKLLDGKRSPEMGKSGFHSDVFNGGFGEFHPM